MVTSGLLRIVPAQTTYWLKIDSPVADEIWPAGGHAQTVRWSVICRSLKNLNWNELKSITTKWWRQMLI